MRKCFQVPSLKGFCCLVSWDEGYSWRQPPWRFLADLGIKVSCFCPSHGNDGCKTLCPDMPSEAVKSQGAAMPKRFLPRLHIQYQSLGWDPVGYWNEYHLHRSKTYWYIFIYIYYLIHSDNDMIRYMYIYICYINIGINKYACLGVVKGATAPRSSNYIWFSPTKGHVTGVCHGCRRLVVSQRAKDHAWWAASRASCTADDLATDRRIATDTTDRGTFHLWLCWRSADRWVGDVCESMHQTKQEQARG